MTNPLKQLNDVLSSFTATNVFPDACDDAQSDQTIHSIFLDEGQTGMSIREVEIGYQCWEYADYGRNVRSSNRDIFAVAKHSLMRGENLSMQVTIDVELGRIHSYPQLIEEVKNIENIKKQEQLERITQGIAKLEAERNKLLED